LARGEQRSTSKLAESRKEESFPGGTTMAAKTTSKPQSKKLKPSKKIENTKPLMVVAH
jgi:hypothetical protein